jgi:hypothetical protein
MPSTPSKTPTPAPTTTKDMNDARAGDRGPASGRNIEQNRAIGQDDPMEGSRMGREQHKARGYPGSGEAGDGQGTDASQVAEGANDKR